MKPTSKPRDCPIAELKDRNSAETSPEEVHVHVERLERIVEQLDVVMTGKKYIAGPVAKGAEITNEDPEPALYNPILIGPAQNAAGDEIFGNETTCARPDLAHEIAVVLQKAHNEAYEADNRSTPNTADLDIDMPAINTNEDKP